MAFIPKNEFGEYPMDPNELPPEPWDLTRAEQDLQRWEAARRPWGQPPAGRCPHEDDFCGTRRECLGKFVWWRRYIREIEGIA